MLTWYLRSISKTKMWNSSVRAWISTWFISKMSQAWPTRCTKMSQTWPKKMVHQKKNKQTNKQTTIDFHTKYMKLFVNNVVHYLHHLCITQYKIPLHIRKYLHLSHFGAGYSFVQSHWRGQLFHGLYSWPWQRFNHQIIRIKAIPNSD